MLTVFGLGVYEHVTSVFVAWKVLEQEQEPLCDGD